MPFSNIPFKRKNLPCHCKLNGNLGLPRQNHRTSASNHAICPVLHPANIPSTWVPSWCTRGYTRSLLVHQQLSSKRLYRRGPSHFKCFLMMSRLASIMGPPTQSVLPCHGRTCSNERLDGNHRDIYLAASFHRMYIEL